MMATQTKYRKPRFDKYGRRWLSISGEEFLCHFAREVKVPDSDQTVLECECRVIITTKDGRVWNSVVSVELYEEGT